MAARGRRHKVAIGTPLGTDPRFELARAARAGGRPDHALAHYESVLRRDPGHFASLVNLGNLRLELGENEEADRCYRRALAVDPGYLPVQSSRLFLLNADPEATPEEVFAAHRRWARGLSAPPPAPDFANDPDPERALRVGYVSADLRRHPVSYFLVPILAHRDRTSIVNYCYAEGGEGDAVSAQLRGLADGWRAIRGFDDARFCELVRADGIDVLVDLSGHTAGNRLGAFHRRAAPVQITYLGYPNTTGLEAMDFRLTDAAADPPETAQPFTETLLRLERCFLCYAPSAESPAPGPAPCTRTGGVTFGSFNHLAKLNARVVALWSEILRAVPDSRLLLKTWGLRSERARARCRKRFEAAGVDPDRVRLSTPLAGYLDHLAAYRQLDVALDPFPYNGTTTTFEALWMGVPVVTMAGAVHAANVGRSILGHAGCGDLVADSPADYAAKACTLAGDRPRLDDLHRCLRPRLVASGLCDGAAMARELARVYRHAWRCWCEREPARPGQAR